jgi:hypothetical protein
MKKASWPPDTSGRIMESPTSRQKSSSSYYYRIVGICLFLGLAIRPSYAFSEDPVFEVVANSASDHDIVREKRDTEDVGKDQTVSEWAKSSVGRLNSSHLHLMVHWAGQVSFFTR